MGMHFRWLVTCFVGSLFIGGAATPRGQAVEPSFGDAKIEKGTDVRAFVIILDCSGSMKDVIEGEGQGSKFAAAQQATIELINSIPDGRQVSLVIYGHDVRLDCQAATTVRQLTPIDAAARGELEKGIRSLQPLGKTPIALSLKLAADQLTATKELSKVILISDGLETCKGDPAAEAHAMCQKFPYLAGGVDVIGFGLKEDESAALRQIADAGRGTYYDAQSKQELLAFVDEIGEEVVEEEPLPPLSPAEQVLVTKLLDVDLEVRTQAAKALQKRKALGALPYLVNVLANDEWDNYAGEATSRTAALEAIIALDPTRVPVAVLAGLTCPNPQVRSWTAANPILVKVQDERLAPVLIALLRDVDLGPRRGCQVARPAQGEGSHPRPARVHCQRRVGQLRR